MNVLGGFCFAYPKRAQNSSVTGFELCKCAAKNKLFALQKSNNLILLRLIFSVLCCLHCSVVNR